MNTFEFEIVKENVYRIIIKDSDGRILNVMERQDYRDTRTAIIGLFAFVHPCWLSFDNKELDRFLFL